MENFAAPILSIIHGDSAANAVELFSCPELPDWAPPQKSCPKTPMAHPANDHYEFWQGISW